MKTTRQYGIIGGVGNLSVRQKGQRMVTQASTLDKLRVLESLYRQGYQSEVVDQALDKIIALEKAHISQGLRELKTRLEAFEQEHQMPSREFHHRFHDGELGDEADFFEWSALYDMAQVLRQRLRELEIEAL